MGGYTVGIAGHAVNVLPFGSGGLTPSPLTIFSNYLNTISEKDLYMLGAMLVYTILKHQSIVYEVEDRKLYKKALRFCSIMSCTVVMLM